MAVITYRQEAVLGAYQTWLMQQGAQACLDRIVKGQEPPLAMSAGCGPYALAGTSIRYTVSTTLASASVSFSGQLVTDSGMRQSVGETVVATSAGGVTQLVRPATAGSYANMVASVGAATVGAGEVYVVAELGRTNNGAFTPYAVLFKGYPESNTPLDICAGTFMQNQPSTSTGGGACVCPSTYVIQGIDGIQAPQGWQVNRTPAAGTVERVVNFNFYMETGGSAGNRYMFMENVVVGAGPVFYQRTANDIAASAQMTFQSNAEIGASFNEPDVRYGVLPGQLWYAQEYQLQVGIGNFIVGDEIFDAYAIIEVKA